MGNSIVQFRGAETLRGTSTLGDVLQFTTDGRDISELWNEISQALDVWNEHKQKLIDFLTYPVTSVVEDVPQGSTAEFELASEFGEPKGHRNGLNIMQMGYDFNWYDLAQRMTWRFVAEASSEQINALNNQALEADKRLVFNKVMQRVFNPKTSHATLRGNAYTVYSFWNGSDGMGGPPAYGPNTFSDDHNHYVATGSATLAPGDLEDAEDDLRSHGYTRANGNRLILMVNPQEAKVIRGFKAGTNSATYDFVPAQGQPAIIVANQQGLIGEQVAGELDGLTVIGSYGNLTIVEEDYIPATYLFAFATGGDAALTNPIGFREHVKPELRGLRILPGNRQGYPLVDSFYSRGFGTGVRQRSAGYVIQVTTKSTYTAPSEYA